MWHSTLRQWDQDNGHEFEKCEKASKDVKLIVFYPAKNAAYQEKAAFW